VAGVARAVAGRAAHRCSIIFAQDIARRARPGLPSCGHEILSVGRCAGVVPGRGRNG
jgi:hypothetical protein